MKIEVVIFIRLFTPLELLSMIFVALVCLHRLGGWFIYAMQASLQWPNHQLLQNGSPRPVTSPQRVIPAFCNSLVGSLVGRALMHLMNSPSAYCVPPSPLQKLESSAPHTQGTHQDFQIHWDFIQLARDCRRKKSTHKIKAPHENLCSMRRS